MADITSLGESSQALLCSLADYLGDVKTNQLFNINDYDTYSSFKKAVKPENIKVINYLENFFKNHNEKLKKKYDNLEWKSIL